MKRIEFAAWPKTPRLNRDITITEKIDGTNGAIHVIEGLFVTKPEEYGAVASFELGDTAYTVGAQSRNRLVTPEADNFGFARWVKENATELAPVLGNGVHYGEWWGSGVGRGYGLPKGEKGFSLFNVNRYSNLLNVADGPVPWGLGIVPILYTGPFSQDAIEDAVARLREHGSSAAPGFMRPEGVIVFHSASQQVYKVLLEGDDVPKGLAA